MIFSSAFSKCQTAFDAAERQTRELGIERTELDYLKSLRDGSTPHQTIIEGKIPWFSGGYRNSGHQPGRAILQLRSSSVRRLRRQSEPAPVRGRRRLDHAQSLAEAARL